MPNSAAAFDLTYTRSCAILELRRRFLALSFFQDRSFSYRPTANALVIYPWLLLAGLVFFAMPANGQHLADTLIQWQGYSSPGKTRAQIFVSTDKKERTHVVVLQELAENQGPAIYEDLEYLVEEIGRAFHLDPAGVYWVLHLGAFSFPEATSGKEVFIRATFRRTRDDRLGAPQWRIIRREDVETLTDRLFF